jgi:hypothetical protein
MIEQALKNLTALQEQIDNALTNDLGNVTMVFPDFASKLHQNIRFGCFGDHGAITLQPSNFSAFILDLAYFTMIEDKLSLLTGLKMFGSEVPQSIRNRSVMVKIETYDPGVFTVMSCELHPRYDDTRITIIPILPPPYVLFDEDENYLKVPEWKWEYISEYEEWSQKIYDAERKFRRSYYQIGGWGSFRQHSYDESYIAQVNTEHGDNGAVYVTTHEQVHIHAFDQMC